jgi:thiopeptide-type bacteriocin biosynthesis protein
MQRNYLNPTFIVRLPLLPFGQLLSKFGRIDYLTLMSLFEEPELQHALFIASPVLHHQLIKALKGEPQDAKFVTSILKYYIRLTTRCTPYGLFAGLHTGIISDSKTSVITKAISIPKLRLDMDYLVNVYHDICKDESLSKALVYKPNTSLYKIATKWRYHEFKVLNKRTVFLLVNIDDNVVLTKLIKQTAQGKSYDECKNTIIQFGFDETEAEQYLNELIQGQVLVNELYPNVSGAEYQTVLFEKLSKFEKYKNLPNAVNKLLANQETIITKTTQIKDALSTYFTTAINESRFIQVDTLKQAKVATINESIPAQVLEAAELLNKLSGFDESQITLSKFKKAFYERYEDAEMPLLELLDTDIGINYKNASSEIEYRSSNRNNMLWDAFAKFKFDLYIKAQKKNLAEIIITDEEVKQFKTPNHKLPNSMAFMGELFQEKDATKIGWGGLYNNATILPGRFGHLDESIKSLCVQLAEKEEALQPDKIFAEVVHISEGRLGNILTRPHYRNYEIPYLAQSTLLHENQIQVSDLMVSVQNSKVVLRSKRLNKEVLPRMANAHNYSGMGLPVYHFLCDLQHQGIKGYFGWQWGFLDNERFLPRVTYKNVILSTAYWNVPTLKLKEIQKLNAEQRSTKFTEIKKEFDLPERVFLSEGDNELLLDFNNPLCIDILLDAAKKSSQLKLTECLFTENNLLVKDEYGNGYTNEIIIPFVKIKEERENSDKADLAKNSNSKAHSVNRIFEPYSEWVYFKVYTGTKTADKIIANQIASISKKLKKEGIINKWFFIRYADPKNHLRIRFNLSSTTSFNTLNNLLQKQLSPMVKSGLIWKIQTDTYQRELERYGHETMELSEDFFYINSEAILGLLKLFSSDAAQENRFIIGLLGVVKLYDAYGYSIQERLSLIEEGAISYGREFGLQNSQQLRDKIKTDYRKLLPQMEFLLAAKSTNTGLDLAICTSAERIYKKQNKALLPIAKMFKFNSYEKSIDELMSSYIHMFVNRFFSDNQRFQELIIYQLLEKYYKAQISRQKYNPSSNGK